MTYRFHIGLALKSVRPSGRVCLLVQSEFHVVADVEWDAGDLGCGPLLLELRNRLRTMPGQVFKLTSADPGSPEDLPVWCRLSRNELLRHDPQTKSYWIRSRLDWE